MYEFLKSKQPSIFVLGSKGQLGKEFVEHLNDIKYDYVYDFNSSQIDITNKKIIKDTLFKVKKNDIVINCAAYNNVYGPELDNEKETEKIKCFKVNALGPKYLAKFCKKNKAKLVHFSTNYIFEDSSCTMKKYSEFDKVKPYLFYGFSKLCGENFIKELGNDKFLILRTAWLFSKNGSLIKMIEKHAEEGKEISMTSSIGNPTYTLDVVKQTMTLLDNKMSGIYHCVNKGTTTKKNYIEEIINILKDNFNQRLFTNVKVKTILGRSGPSMPLRNFMLNMEGLNQMRDWKEALYDCFKIEK